MRRDLQCVLWSRGEEIITDRFPEIIDGAALLPEGTVLDGEILAGTGDAVLPFLQLQQRIGRRKLTPKMLQQIPARFVAYDLLELAGEDWRSRPLRERRARLEKLLLDASVPVLSLSPAVPAGSWAELAALRNSARSRGVEGLMLKDWSSTYGTGRQRGAWWKWKVDPFVFDAVLLYAAPGHGRRSNLYTDYTFGVWREAELVPVAKAYSGLSDDRDPSARRVDSQKYAGEVRDGAKRGADPRVRARLRGYRAFVAPQVGHRAAISAHRALAQRQAGRGSQYSGGSARTAARAGSECPGTKWGRPPRVASIA